MRAAIAAAAGSLLMGTTARSRRSPSPNPKTLGDQDNA